MIGRLHIVEAIGAGRILLLVALCWATGARADEMLLGVNSQYVFNSNFFSSDVDPETANSFLIGPSLELLDADGRFRYDLTFLGAYQIYVDQSDVDAWESRVRARLTYDLSRRTRLQLTERFRDVSNLRFSRQDLVIASGALDPNQDRYFRNDLELALSHDLTRLLELRVGTAWRWIDFQQNIDRNDSQALEVGSELRYQVATSHNIGLAVDYIYQDIIQARARLGSTVNSLATTVGWTWQIADNILFTANGGPALLRSVEDDTTEVTQDQFVGGSDNGELFRANIGSCDPVGGQPIASNCDFATPAFPPIPADDLGELQSFTLSRGRRVGTERAVTFFGGASFFASLADWNYQATYTRRQSTTAGAGLAAVLDLVYTEFELAPTNLRWSTFVAGSWDRRQALIDATTVDFTVFNGGNQQAQRDVAFSTINDNRNRQDNFTAIVGVRGAINRNAATTLEFRYRRREDRNRNVTQPGINTYFIVFTLDYLLDPISY